MSHFQGSNLHSHAAGGLARLVLSLVMVALFAVAVTTGVLLTKSTFGACASTGTPSAWCSSNQKFQTLKRALQPLS
jgi:membrane glycosyltransferase